MLDATSMYTQGSQHKFYTVYTYNVIHIKINAHHSFFASLIIDQGELAALESQGRIAKLSSDDLQAKLMQAFAENEELARKLRETEEELRNKVG